MAKKKKQDTTPDIQKRAPIVVVMGHIDHGKSTLLDFIRKSTVVEAEAGGITQHLSAYEVEHTTKEGATESLTFLDTPGHAAFQKMRLRGADIADIAILVVSAEDGVKPQTREALESIKEAGIPFIVAINKIDKPGANVAHTQSSLLENEIYIEGMGGDIPWTNISAVTGEGIPELLDLIVLSADMLELDADVNATASGTVIEGHIDKKRGTTATLIVEQGTLSSGQFVVTDTTYAPVRIMEDFTGNSIRRAGPGTPVGIVGFSAVPTAGSSFTTVTSKKEAETYIQQHATDSITTPNPNRNRAKLPAVPILIKADVLGSLEAVEHEIAQFNSDRIEVRIIGTDIGPVTHSDVQFASATENAIIVGFNVPIERNAQELADRTGVEIDSFAVIYDLSEWITSTLAHKTPKQEEEVVTGHAKILKHFSVQKNTHVLGARVEDGSIKLGQKVRILRRDVAIGTGAIKNVQQYKSDVQEVSEGEFGIQIETRADIAAGDVIASFNIEVT
jgi:translation initiation factor IF-2